MALALPKMGGFMFHIQRDIILPKNSFFLFGPRGTGKSTLVQERFPDAFRIDLLKPENERRFLAYPERLSELLLAEPQQKTVIIDEVQKVPTLLTTVHRLIEEKSGYQFILTGSSARKLKRTGADLLGGRAAKRTLHPFMACELGGLFNLEKALKWGLLPLIVDSITPDDQLQAYISLYLQEEIKAEGLVRNMDSFARFLEAITFSHGAELVVSNVANECEVKRKTVENYIDILEDLLLGFRLRTFSKRAKRQVVQHPKFYLFDPGVFRALRPKGPLDRPEEIDGAALEGLVAQQLRAFIDYSENKYELFFWRTVGGVEVDFVLYGENGIWAIEVKNEKKVHPAELKPLKAFLQDYPIAKALFLYRGDEKREIDNILCMPVETFLRELKPNQSPNP